MKKEYALISILLFVVVLLSAFLFVGCVHYPALQDFPKGTSRACIRAERCWYYAAKGKVVLDCSILQESCNKGDVFLDYPELKEQKRLPEIYDKNGSHEMSFQEYWDKVR